MLRRVAKEGFQGEGGLPRKVLFMEMAVTWLILGVLSRSVFEEFSKGGCYRKKVLRRMVENR